MAQTQEFSADNVRVILYGREIACKRITYTAKQEKNPYYKLGQNTPHTRVKQRKNFEGELEIYQSDYNAIVLSLPLDQDILDVNSSDVVILYSAGSRVSTRILRNVEVTEFGEETDAENDLVMVTLPFVFEKVIQK